MRRALLASLLLVGLAGPAHAAHPPLTLAEVVAEVRSRNPALTAQQRRVEAARARVEGTGLLPDPMVEASLMSLTRLMGPQLTVSQLFPMGPKLELERQLAAQEAELAELTYRDALNVAIAEAKKAYMDLAYAQATAGILDRRKATLDGLLKVATAKYAVGGGRQSDVVRVSAEIAELLHERTELDRERDIAQAALDGLLNRPLATGHHARTQVAAVAIAPARRDGATILARAERDNPTLAIARAELALAELRLQQARTVATPDLTARLGLGQTFMGTMDGEPAVVAMVGSNMPYWNGKRREQAAVEAAEAELASRRANLEQQRRQLQVGIRQALAHLGHLEEQARLISTGLLPQGRQALQSELTAYQVNRTDFAAVVAAQNTLFRYERERESAIAEHEKMVADLQRLTGQEVAAQEAP